MEAPFDTLSLYFILILCTILLFVMHLLMLPLSTCRSSIVADSMIRSLIALCHYLLFIRFRSIRDIVLPEPRRLVSQSQADLILMYCVVFYFRGHQQIRVIMT